ncbi:MAG: hypothetical protein AAF602_26695, partial [Myxococcota bacterium]
MEFSILGTLRTLAQMAGQGVLAGLLLRGLWYQLHGAGRTVVGTLWFAATIVTTWGMWVVLPRVEIPLPVLGAAFVALVPALAIALPIVRGTSKPPSDVELDHDGMTVELPANPTWPALVATLACGFGGWPLLVCLPVFGRSLVQPLQRTTRVRISTRSVEVTH